MNALCITDYSIPKCPITGTMIIISGIIGIYTSSHKQKTPLMWGLKRNNKVHTPMDG